MPGTSSERPRDICLQEWSKIAARFEPAGFRFVKTGSLKRTRHGFREEVFFQASTWNRSGILVAFTGAGMLWNDDLGRWRAVHGDPPHNYAGLARRNLERGAEYWNLVDPSARHAVVDEVTERIKESILPWFVLIETTDTLVEQALVRDIPDMEISRLVEYLVFLSRKHEAERVLAAWIARRETQGIGIGYVERLNRLSAHYQLDLPPLPPARETARLEAAIKGIGPIAYLASRRDKSD